MKLSLEYFHDIKLILLNKIQSENYYKIHHVNKLKVTVLIFRGSIISPYLPPPPAFIFRVLFRKAFITPATLGSIFLTSSIGAWISAVISSLNFCNHFFPYFLYKNSCNAFTVGDTNNLCKRKYVYIRWPMHRVVWFFPL